MNRPTLAAALLVTSFLASTCGKDSPAAPSNQTPTPTRIIRLGGNLNFGNVTIGEVRNDGILLINNDGNAALTVTGLTGPCATAYSVSWTSGSIAPGQVQNVGVRFAPTVAQNCTGTLTVNGDQTTGTNTITITGVGVAPSGGGNPTPTPTGCSYSLNPSTVTLGTSGSFVKATLQLTTTSNCAWTVMIADSWLTAKQNSGTGSASIDIEATGNTGAARTTLLTVGSAVATITQSAGSSPSPSPSPTRTRTGARCNDGTTSTATGSGACSSHGGVSCWFYNDGTCTNPLAGPLNISGP